MSLEPNAKHDAEKAAWLSEEDIAAQIEAPKVEVPNKNGYSEMERRNAAFHYMVYGNYAKIARILNIPRRTLMAWKNEPWWQELVSAYRDQMQDELDAGFTQVVYSATTRIIDALENGDEVVTKDGKIVRKKPTGRETAMIMGIFFDKRQLVRNNPTSISQKGSAQELADAAAKFEKISTQKGKEALGEVLEDVAKG